MGVEGLQTGRAVVIADVAAGFHRSVRYLRREAVLDMEKPTSHRPPPLRPFLERFDHERPHQALGMKVPGDLGNFDDETCRLDPIANPFGPKVLPMSQE
jgi:hypothetical protein